MGAFKNNFYGEEVIMRNIFLAFLAILIAIPVLGAEENKPATSIDKEKFWTKPRTSEREKERMRMVRYQIKDRGVKGEKALEAMQNVPRHWFVLEKYQSQAYDDNPLQIGYEQTISQPYIVALMTELLEIDSDSKVLEIGTGSGYQAAVLNEITPCVYTIEIIKELAQAADERLKNYGYKTIEVKNADGYYGWEREAPFDAIIVTAAATHIPPPLFKQLKAGGKMVIPVGAPMSVQNLILVTKDENGRPIEKSILPVRFVPLVHKEAK